MLNDFRDPNPPIKGAPSTRIGGIRFKSPSVDEKNIEISTSSKNDVSFISTESDVNFTPNKFDPQELSGNTKYTDPTTGEIRTTEKEYISKKINVNDVPPSKSLESSSKKLNQIKNSMPVPLREVPVGNRVREVKLKTKNINVNSSEQIRKSSLKTYI